MADRPSGSAEPTQSAGPSAGPEQPPDGTPVGPSSATAGEAAGRRTAVAGPPVISSLDVLSRNPLHWRINRAHPGPVVSVAFGTTPDGRAVLASGGGDGSVRLWDLAQLATTPTILTGHTGPVRSVAFGTTPDGRAVLASGGGDGSVRLWDLAQLATTPTILTGHTGPVWSVAFGTTPDGATVTASADFDSVIHVAEVTDRGYLPDRATEPGAEGLYSLDSEFVEDLLGRRRLAGHLAGVITQIVGPGGGSDRAVISIEGRWGSGKSVLARLLEQHLAEAPSGGVGRPIVVHFDAWRESNLGPEWWSLTSALSRAIRHERAGVTRVALALAGSARRVVRSRAVLTSAFVAVALTLAAGALSGDRSTSGLEQSLKLVSTLVTGVAGFAALGLAIGRVLFWSSPAVGRLYVKTDDNPLGEISDIVGRLRRWSPRDRVHHRWADSALALWSVIAGALVIHVYLRREALVPAVSPTVREWFHAHISGWSMPFVAGLLALVVVSNGLSRPSRHRVSRFDSGQRSDRAGPPRRAAGNAPTRRMKAAAWSARAWRRCMDAVENAMGHMVLRRVVPVLFAFAAAGLVKAVTAVGTLQDALLLLGAWLILGPVPYVAWLWRTLSRPRQPVLLVIDDLDRCHEASAVKYLETVHTLLRAEGRPRAFGRWRAPAPLVVLVLADGRWVRQAFTKQYETFKDLGDETRALGADFIQKLFDHTVLVPELAFEQVRQYAAIVTRSSYEPPAGLGPGLHRAMGAEFFGRTGWGRDVAGLEVLSEAPAQTPQGGSPSSSGVAAAPPPAVRPLTTEQLMRDLRARHKLEADQAQAAADLELTKDREKHLLNQYPTLLPANPRLIRRVVNMWGMLNELRSHVGHGHDDEELVRAAVFFVRFPTLVDELISTQTPPSPGDLLTDRWATPDPDTTQWRRRDVLEVLRLGDGTYLAPKTLGECYGRQYPAAPTPTPAPAPVT